MQFDVLILGSGVAALSAAISLSKNKKLKVAIVSREKELSESNSFYAQGGIVYEKTDLESLAIDIQNASSRTSNQNAVDFLSDKQSQIIDDILIKQLEVPFKKDSEGRFELTQEGAHRVPRILFSGDHTGKTIVQSMLKYLKENCQDNIFFLTEMTAIDLITPNHHGIDFSNRYLPRKVVGAYLLDQRKGVVEKVISKSTILATGGVSAVYLHHTNTESCRGDGHAMAQRAGAFVENMEFIQFHPTTFYDRFGHQRFLISEALRGEGGKLINSKGENFMTKYHSAGELASRDIVARSILKEMLIQNAACVYLDMTHLGQEYLSKRFPTIDQFCKSKNIDMSKDPIPVVPAAHYSCGGIVVDLKGKTNLENLYAIGEVSCTGLHGANRLASTSLLEGLVWGFEAAKDIAEKIEHQIFYQASQIKDWKLGLRECDLALVRQDFLTLKQTMWNYVGPIRSTRRLNRASAMLSELYNHVSHFYRHSQVHDELIGLRNAIETSLMVVKASMRNTNPIGCFYLDEDTGRNA